MYVYTVIPTNSNPLFTLMYLLILSHIYLLIGTMRMCQESSVMKHVVYEHIIIMCLFQSVKILEYIAIFTNLCQAVT